jgi:hypothetical protein
LARQISKAALIEYRRRLHLIAAWWLARKGGDHLPWKGWHTGNDTGRRSWGLRLCKSGGRREQNKRQ